MTLKEIANKAGVSSATVSLVLNNRPGVNEQTRKQVLKLLDEYDYSPKKRENLRKFPLSTIFVVKHTVHGMIVEENQGFISSILDQIAQCCHDSNIEVSIAVCNQGTLIQTLNNINKSGVDGVIFVGTEISGDVADTLKKINCPFVVIDNSLLNKNINSVLMANPDIGYIATKHLIECGYEEIGYLYSSVAASNFFWRKWGYENALEEFHVTRGVNIAITPTLERAYEDMSNYLRSAKTPLPNAFFADNDTIAIGAMRAIQEFGYRIPEDISIIGVDNIPFSAVSSPPLTTISISRQEIGIQAMNLLKYKAEHPESPPIRIQICGELLIRNSTMHKSGATNSEKSK